MDKNKEDVSNEEQAIFIRFGAGARLFAFGGLQPDGAGF